MRSAYPCELDPKSAYAHVAPFQPFQHLLFHFFLEKIAAIVFGCSNQSGLRPRPFYLSKALYAKRANHALLVV